MNRRTFLKGAIAGAAALTSTPRAFSADNDLNRIRKEIEKRHDESVRRLQDWIRQPSIAAENRGVSEGCDLTIRLLRDAGFQRAERVPTDGQLVIFATLDAGAPRTVGLYFMYDVKQVDPAEWSSPPWDGLLVNKPGLGKVLMGRGAVNQKGPQAALLAALHAVRGAGRKLPVNLVLVAEGEEEIGSPHFPQIVRRPEVLAALQKSVGIFMPSSSEGLVGGYTGPGGKTILPHRAVAKLDLRLVPDMTAADALAALKAHLAKRGFGDIEVNMSGGYDPTSTLRDAMVIRAQEAVYRRARIDPILLPRNAGSWPGYVFTGEPLKLAAGQFGLGHGSGAHAPDEYYVIESTNPKVQGIDVFFFQAEDGIRDYKVTGVQTCALPISRRTATMRSSISTVVTERARSA